MSASLVAAAVGKLLNILLSNNIDTRSQLSRLAGIRVQCKLSELATPLTLQIQEQAFVVVANGDHPFDCRITARLSALLKLRDPNQLIPLIRAGQLDIEGDLILLQRLVSWFTLIDWDLEEQLSRSVGDVVAHAVVRRIRRTQRLVQQQAQQRRDWLRELLVEVWRLLPSRAEAVPFFQAIAQLQAETQRLANRLQALPLPPVTALICTAHETE
ncbi:ubiquinone biosynthesis accessory factor UbiJ [unidentified bacterial endosymbiont]|uniref:ubiquinone biosynthesis accessory factor UbiJ n=1 Tax=unidentified bacterial endosymbiont TaxID=2355 RepID=UPI0020A18AD2|nr:SCP2 sterol-binding domain-containing protein [unidentified bacterial endosymbiont]